MFKRILSLAPSNTEILFALGAADKIAGTTYLCDYPEEAKKLPKVASWIYANDLKLFDRINPDLILSSMYVPKNVEEWAEKNKVELINVYPQTINGIFKSIKTIGKLAEKEENAKDAIKDIKTRLAQIREKSKFLPKLRIYCEEWHRPPTVSANWVPELIEIAGGRSMAKKGLLSHEINLEKLKKFNPDLIVLHWCGFGIKSKIDEIKNRTGWPELKAVRNKRVFSVNDTFLNRPGPRIWKGAEILQELIKIK